MSTHTACPGTLLYPHPGLSFTGTWMLGTLPPYARSFKPNLVQGSSFKVVMIPPVFLFRKREQDISITLRFLFKSSTPGSEQVSNGLKAKQQLSLQLSLLALGWCRAPDTVRERRNDLARQTLENKCSPDNMRWLSTWMTMEHDNDKCRLPPPESLI